IRYQIAYGRFRLSFLPVLRSLANYLLHLRLQPFPVGGDDALQQGIIALYLYLFIGIACSLVVTAAGEKRQENDTGKE
ncbi:MAG TPA: hypothetical protein DHW15_07765, partial [Bacteroidetes bacterium]|nr:hypothetical protein [Bacteroidota bacterium]